MNINIQRASVFVEGLGNDIICPFVDASHNLYYILQGSGEVISIDQSGSTEVIHNTSGQPSGATFDDQGVLYVADQAQAAILAVNEVGSEQQELVVGVYEDKPLRGPHSVACAANGDVFFTDSGPFGETGLQAPEGSLFVISNTPNGQMLKPISLGNLAGTTTVSDPRV
jgi:aspartate beta-hydroxylase